MLSGDNGILQKATTAKENTVNSQIQEQINLAYHSSLVDGRGKVTEPSLESELKKEFNKDTLDEGWLDKTSVQGKWRITIDEVSLEVPAGEEADNNATIKVGTTNLKDVSNLSTLYGQTTDYTSVSGIEWQLFYDDNDYVYLIASDYVSNSQLPCNGNIGFGTIDLLKSENTTNQFATYCARFASSTSYNDGPLTEGTIYRNGSESSTFKESNEITYNYISTNYLKWVLSYPSSTKKNICAVAYMMDTNKWRSFAGDITGACAYGGPTIEMLSLSWNAVDGHTKMTSYESLLASNSTATGYKSNSPEANHNFFGVETNMWCIKENTKAASYWLASPSNGSSGSFNTVSCDGNVNSGYASSDNFGFRPLVSIPKSSLK